MGTYTPFLHLYMPANQEVGWAALVAGDFATLDAYINQFMQIPNFKGVWLNNTAYSVGDVLLDTDLYTFWRCMVAHTSAAVGTFATDRTANPTFWDGAGASSSAAAFLQGISFGSQLAASATDLSKHIALWSTTYGFNITSNRLNYVVPTAAAHRWLVNGVEKLLIDTNNTTVSTLELRMGSVEFALVVEASNRFLRLSNTNTDFLQYNIAARTLQWVVGGVTRATFASNGDFTISGAAFKPGGGSWTATSDARVKTETEEYTVGLTELVGLRPVVYRYNDASGYPTDHDYVGLVGQEAELVMPELVTHMPGMVDDTPVGDLRVVDPSALVYALINAVKELSARVAALEA